MRRFTDLFIERPVLACVVSLLILVLGLRSIDALPVSQYPRTQNAVVTVSTTYYGADADTVAGFITQPLESSIAQAQGIDYLSSASVSGVSTITATLRLNYDANRALTEITTRVNAVRNQLPPQAQQPVMTVQTGQTTDAMYLGFYSDRLPANGITDYLTRVVKPRLDALPGVQTAEILGGRTFALRAWLDPSRMAAHGVAASDVYAALSTNNYVAAVGSTKGESVAVDLRAGTDLHGVDDFKRLVVKQAGGAVVRLEDVANVVLGSESYDTNVAFGGQRSVFIGIKVAPDANILDVAQVVRDTFPSIRRDLPSGMKAEIAYDATDYIHTSIREVVSTLVEALAIVTAVIFVFLGSWRAIAVPVLAMPLSLVGTFFVMLALGYSINLLTLLALVLAIGLVVDDAIIVAENVDRHMHDGAHAAAGGAARGARAGGPIIAMTIVLVAVYLPIGFQGGLTGALFTEFAFTLAGAVAVSGVVALTLSPMLCARFFRPEQDSGRFARKVDVAVRAAAQRLQPHADERAAHLGRIRDRRRVAARRHRLPVHDRAVRARAGGRPGHRARADHRRPQRDGGADGRLCEADLRHRAPAAGVPADVPGHRRADRQLRASAGVLLKPWDQRGRSAKEIQQELQQQWNRIAGARVAAFQFPPLPGASGLAGAVRHQHDRAVGQPREGGRPGAREGARERPVLLHRFGPEDRQAAGRAGDRPRQGRDPGPDAAGRRLGAGVPRSAAATSTTFRIDGRSYKVIPQVQQTDGSTRSRCSISTSGCRTASVVPASTVAHLEQRVRARVDQPLPAAEFGDDLRRRDPDRLASAGAGLAAQMRCAKSRRRATRSTTAVRRGSSCTSRAASR